MKLIILILKGVIREQSTRRTVMFIVVIAAMLMLFLGVTFLSGWLTHNPVAFLIYWAACAWMTFASILLALYDLLVLRSIANREKQRLKNEIFRDDDKTGKA